MSEKYEKTGVGLGVQTMETNTPLAVQTVGWQQTARCHCTRGTFA